MRWMKWCLRPASLSCSGTLGNGGPLKFTAIYGEVAVRRRMSNTLTLTNSALALRPWVTRNRLRLTKESHASKTQFSATGAPHYHFLGSFHTHPYPSLEDVNNNKGWEFSDDDKATILGDEDVWELSHPGTPIAMVMAVTKMAAVYDSFVGVKAGRLEFNVGNLRFWLSVAVGEVSSGKEKVFSTDNILFNPHSRHYNRAGARLDGVD